MNKQDQHALERAQSIQGIEVQHIDTITLETKQSVLDSVIEANNRLPRYASDRIERFFNGIPSYKA